MADKKDETKVYTPLTDPEFRAKSLTTISIEERRKWEVMFARFHQPHGDLTTQMETFRLPPGGENGDFLMTDGEGHYSWSGGACHWLAAGKNIYYATGNIAVGDTPNDTNTIYAKGNILVQATAAQPYIKISNASATARDPVLQFAVGASPAVKHTLGVDDSDGDKWKLAAGDSFGTDNDIIVVDNWAGSDPGVSEFEAHASWTIAGSPVFSGVCVVGDYLYYTRAVTDQLVKFNLLTGAEDSSTAYPGSPYFYSMLHCATDGDYIYVSCATTHKIRKYDLNLNYIAQTAAWSGSTTGEHGLCYWAGHLYWANLAKYAVKKVRCSDLAFIWETSFTSGSGDNQLDGPYAVGTNGAFLYVQDMDNNRVVRLNMDGTWVDHVDIATGTMDINNPTLWVAGQYFYIVVDYGAGDYRIEKRSCDTLVLDTAYATASNDTTQGILHGNYHYVLDDTNDKIYEYYWIPSGAFADSGIQFRLSDAYAHVVDVVRITGLGYLGVGTNVPSERIEALGNIKATSGKLISTIPTGTMPVDVDSTTLCTNLNADMLDGYHAASFVALPADPGADRILFWDDSETAVAWLACGNSIAITATTIDTIQDIRTSGSPAFAGLTIGVNGAGGTAGVITLRDGANPGTTATLSYAKWADLEAVNGVIQCNGSGNYSVASVEPALGNPDVDGKVLSSTALGVRSWIAAGGALAVGDLTDVDLTGLADNNILRYDSASGNWLVEALPAGGAHDLNSATHTDVNFGAPGAGEDGYAVVWNNATSKYILSAVAGGGAHALLSATHSDTTASAVSRGSIIIGDSTPKWIELAVGTAGQVVGTDGTDTSWVTPASPAAKYIVQEAHASLSAEQSLGALATGMVKNTTTASVGVLSIAADGTDYLSPAYAVKNVHMRETFDALSTAALNGQGAYNDISAWSSSLNGTSTINVEVKSGADKMVRMTGVAGDTTSTSTATFSNNWALMGGGRISFKIRTNDVDKGGGGLRHRTSAAEYASVGINSSGDIFFWKGSSSSIVLQAAADNTWYEIDMLITPGTGTARNAIVFVDGVYKTTTPTGAFAATVDQIQLWVGPDAAVTKTVDIDDLVVINAFGLET